MAEIGIIASGIGVASFGLQLMDGIRKLKQFWDEVKEAPKDIHDTLEELETLSLILSDIQKSDLNMPSIPSATATRCLELCRRGTDMLNTTVKDMNGAISKRRKIGSVKVVLKKDTLEKFRNRLREAQYMLMLSRQTYSDALQMEYHKLQMEAVQSNANRQLQEFEELKVSITRSVNVMSSTLLQSHDTVVYDSETKRPMRNRTRSRLDKKAKCFQGKFGIPQWFSSSSYTWDFSGYQAPSGWTFNFRQYYTVNYDSPTLKCVTKRDLSGLQVLLQNKKATPFDRSLYGVTLLDVASNNVDYDMCRFLLDQGADPNDSCATSALSFVIKYSSSPSIDVMQLLYPVTEVHSTSDNLLGVANCDSLAWLLGNIDPTFKEWSLEKRMMFALKACCRSIYVFDSTAEIVSLMLHKDQLNEVCCRMVARSYPRDIDCTFLSIELCCITRTVMDWLEENEESNMYSDSTQPRVGRSGFGTSDRFSKTKVATSIEFLERLIAAGSEIYRGGLLCSLLHRMCIIYAPDILRSWVCPVSVRLWLEILHESGIDLLQYGKVEHDDFMESTFEWELHLYISRNNSKIDWCIHAHLISFVYGPAIGDWKFWYSLDEPYPNYYENFQDFWKLVDHPERGMPGAWEEY
ncbi:hypothetical protein BOTCAL_0421g00050 [Botryotinia calthae]|uniref:Fungal N-terminal domain-containing protein n=1 Tax=Botryotinia calthae TaxID=38488 RepID=A0A4Y8CRV4_9HELO|nr:hypothetical protein BOTCAL_0421g00050 [Botryotinia calthae]